MSTPSNHVGAGRLISSNEVSSHTATDIVAMDDFEGVMADSLGTASGLGQLLTRLALNDGLDHWKRIELTAQSLANALRIKDPKGARKCTSYTPVTP
jgi:hypothetical protein